MNSLESFENINHEYSSILKFVNQFNNITYSQFNDHILKDINLFDVPSEDFFDNINETIDRIIKALPAIRRILAKPIVYLKDTHEVVSVEAVKIINNYTISHCALHSELWGDIKEDGIKPKKLMTIEKVETYATYENIAFTRLIDTILRFIRKSIITMKDIIYGCQDIHVNLLDRTHHKLYFFALAKLHIEYARAHERHYSTYFNFIDKLLFIEKNIKPKLNAPVYVQCKKKKKKITLKKTNVFRSHKDYKQIYNLLKWFESDLENYEADGFSYEITSEVYNTYVTILSVFSIGHFNFEFNENDKINFKYINANCSYLDWKLNIRKEVFYNIECLMFNFKKEIDYKICLVLDDLDNIGKEDYNKFKELTRANEYVFVSPTKFGFKDILYLSIYDIDSFRRIQQLLLRGMIYSDTDHGICPFCGNKMNKSENSYDCELCRAEILEQKCPNTNEKYYISRIKKYKSSFGQNENNQEKRKFLHDRFSESQMHFRNITMIDNNGRPICPKCGRRHNI